MPGPGGHRVDARPDRQRLYHRQPFPLTELGYAVPRIESTLVRDGDFERVRDHTFSQLTAMVADVRGSMMLPVSGSPTRNFQAGQVMAEAMRDQGRCPHSMEELEQWCEAAGLRKGGLEGLKSLRYWPQIARKYAIPANDASMVNLLYMAIYGRAGVKETAYRVMTESRELSSYCQESVRPSHSRRYAEALQNLDVPKALELVVNAVIADNANQAMGRKMALDENGETGTPAYLELMDVIESQLET